MDVHEFVRPSPVGKEVQMSFKELYKGPHLSASSIGKYIDCGLLYRFSKIDKLQPEFVPDVLLFGSAIHWAIAHINQGRKVGFLLDLRMSSDALRRNGHRVSKRHPMSSIPKEKILNTC